MKLPKLPFLEKKKNTEYFLSLVLRDEKASAVVFQEIETKINVTGEHVEAFKTSIDNASEDELLNTIDIAVSTAEKSLPDGVESKKTIFGIKESWTKDGKITPENLARLKKLSDTLGFKPMGFLVIPEAVAHLMHKQEGAPVTGILAEIGHKNITIYLLKTGRILETKSAPLGESPVETVETLLKHITTSEILPSRIILFDGGNEKLQQEFMAHKWSPVLGFLHIPQISTLPANFDARAVLSGTAAQLGFQVIESTLNRAVKEDVVIDHGAIDIESPESDEDKTLGEILETQEFGFTEEDINEKKKDNKPLTAVDEDESPTIPISDNLMDPTLSTEFKEIPEEVKINTVDNKEFPEQTAMMTAGIKKYLEKIKFNKIFSGRKGNTKKIALIAIPIAILALIGMFYIFGRSATVTFDIEGKQKEKTETVTFSDSPTANASSSIIPAEFITVDEDGKISTTTTGKKETGDKAKGTITIFNNTDSGKTFAVGTTVTSTNNLDFVLDKAVTIASASGDTFSGTEPGKANVTVTAAKFGTEYNLPSGTKFSVEGGGPSIAAKNDNAFSGGTKKNLKVVAKADQEKLINDLEKQLESNAKTDIVKKASQNSEVLPNFVSTTFSKKTFSKDVDEEASDVSLTAVVTFEGISYKKSDLIAYAKETLKGEIDPNMTINEDNLVVNATKITTKNGKTTAVLNINAEIVPVIDQKALADKIKGKSSSEAESIISEIPEIKNVEIKTTLGFIPLFKNLPFSAGKIKIITNKNG